MLGLVGRGWSRLCSHWKTAAGQETAAADGSGEVSDRIRARYDTARRETKQPTRQWLREQGVMEDWADAWKAVDRW